MQKIREEIDGILLIIITLVIDKNFVVKIRPIEESLSKQSTENFNNSKKIHELEKRQNEFKSLCDSLDRNISQWVKSEQYGADQEILNQKLETCIQYEHLQEHKDFISPIVDEWLGKGNSNI